MFTPASENNIAREVSLRKKNRTRSTRNKKEAWEANCVLFFYALESFFVRALERWVRPWSCRDGTRIADYDSRTHPRWRCIASSEGQRHACISNTSAHGHLACIVTSKIGMLDRSCIWLTDCNRPLHAFQTRHKMYVSMGSLIHYFKLYTDGYWWWSLQLHKKTPLKVKVILFLRAIPVRQLKLVSFFL